MNRFALNFICKDESHVILRMLESVKPLTDLIVAVDTGSTDDTVALIRGFGEKHKIPTYVFERPFDDFGQSRNYALDKLRATVQELRWDPAETWGFRMDCDETVRVSDKFAKRCVGSDLCSAPLHFSNYNNDAKTYRHLFFRLSHDFRWDGPIHEALESFGVPATSDIIPEITITREAVGATWKGDKEKKYLKDLAMVKAHVDKGHRSFKWLFQIGTTYLNLAGYCKDDGRKKDYFKEARFWFGEATTVSIEARHERYKLYQNLADVLEKLGEHRADVEETYLKAYSMDKRHAEPLAAIIRAHIRSRQWHQAYLYSSFAVANYHGNKPTGLDIELVEDALYDWELLLYHCTICIHAGRKEEGKAGMSRLKSILRKRTVPLFARDRMVIRGTLLRLTLTLPFQ